MIWNGLIVAYRKTPEKRPCQSCPKERLFCPGLRIHILGDHILHRLGLHDAHVAGHQLPVLVEMDGGHGGDLVLRRDLGILGGVELDDVQEGDFRLNILQNLGEQLAGDAGRAVKVGNHEVLPDQVLEIGLVRRLNRHGGILL